MIQLIACSLPYLFKSERANNKSSKNTQTHSKKFGGKKGKTETEKIKKLRLI
jgi:hypothetical protein